MKVRLNLATSPLEKNRRFVVFSTIIGGLGLLTMALLSWNVYSMRRSNTALRLEQARMEGNQETLLLRCVRTRNTYRVLNPGLAEEEMAAVQEEVFKVLGWQ